MVVQDPVYLRNFDVGASRLARDKFDRQRSRTLGSMDAETRPVLLLEDIEFVDRSMMRCNSCTVVHAARVQYLSSRD